MDKGARKEGMWYTDRQAVTLEVQLVADKSVSAYDSLGERVHNNALIPVRCHELPTQVHEI